MLEASPSSIDCGTPWPRICMKPTLLQASSTAVATARLSAAEPAVTHGVMSIAGTSNEGLLIGYFRSSSCTAAPGVQDARGARSAALSAASSQQESIALAVK